MAGQRSSRTAEASVQRLDPTPTVQPSGGDGCREPAGSAFLPEGRRPLLLLEQESADAGAAPHPRGLSPGAARPRSAGTGTPGSALPPPARGPRHSGGAAAAPLVRDAPAGPGTPPRSFRPARLGPGKAGRAERQHPAGMGGGCRETKGRRVSASAAARGARPLPLPGPPAAGTGAAAWPQPSRPPRLAAAPGKHRHMRRVIGGSAAQAARGGRRSVPKPVCSVNPGQQAERGNLLLRMTSLASSQRELMEHTARE
ncbi:uncharacterized protein LOC102071098 [Zonotrichia albicollis]|uniref:uncharacterized protein LOC102071098 n=1 Tax=Zonotrichia albicollis TaxID=44394 RepID=UPI003D80B106